MYENLQNSHVRIIKILNKKYYKGKIYGGGKKKSPAMYRIVQLLLEVMWTTTLCKIVFSLENERSNVENTKCRNTLTAMVDN